MNLEMCASFFPSEIGQLQTPKAIAIAQRTQRQAISTSLHQKAIPTAYVKQGEGELPLVLLHGFDSSLLEFRELLPLLAQQQPVWAVDLLGFGFTERILGVSYTPTSLKTHLDCVWETLIGQPVILVGASMGGATAIDFTLTYPERVKKLVLIDSVGFSGGFPIGKYLFPPLDALAVEFWRQRKLQPLFWGSKVERLDAWTLDALRCATLHLQMPRWREAMSSFTRSGGYLDLTDRIGQIQHPTLIIWGENDQMLGTEDANRFASAIASSQLVWIPNAGHVPHLEQPQRTAEEILRFCCKS